MALLPFACVSFFIIPQPEQKRDRMFVCIIEVIGVTFIMFVKIVYLLTVCSLMVTMRQ